MTADRLDGLSASEGSSGRSTPRPSAPRAHELARMPDATRCLHSLEPGQLVAGRYRIERPLRRYGAGCVFQAFDVILNEHVALKAEVAANRDSLAVRSLCLEARLARRVNHPNVLRIHDVGVDLENATGRGALYFITMQLVDGVPLGGLLRSGPLTLATTLLVALQVLAALDAAHVSGVVHGHLAADSVIVRGALTAPVVIVTGFGQLEAWHGMASSDVGEGLHGSLEPTNVETDLSGFARLLLQMLVGHPPEPELVEIAERCSNPGRGDRFRSAIQARRAFGAFAARSAGR